MIFGISGSLARLELKIQERHFFCLFGVWNIGAHVGKNANQKSLLFFVISI